MTERSSAVRTRWGIRSARIVALVIGVSYVAAGVWAFLAPVSFFGSVATFPPYNEHLLHDLGAFQIGLGLTLLLGAAQRAALRPALLAVLVASLLHVASHIEDRSLGGRPDDLLILGVCCALLAAAFVLASLATTPVRGAALQGIREEGR